MSAIVKVFGCRPDDDGATHSGAGVRKPPREETAGRDTLWFVTHYGDLIAGDDAPERSQDDPTRWPRALGSCARGCLCRLVKILAQFAWTLIEQESSPVYTCSLLR